MASGNAPTTSDLNRTDRASAAKVNLRLADLPRGWVLTSPASAVVLNKSACRLAASDSVALNSSTYTSAATGDKARSEIGIATTTTISDDYALLQGPQGGNCITQFMEQFNAGPVIVSGVTRLADMTTPSGVALPVTGFRMTVVPSAMTAAPRTSATEATPVMTAPVTAPVTADAIAIFSGRFEVLTLFTGATKPVNQATETAAINSIVARVNAASTS